MLLRRAMRAKDEEVLDDILLVEALWSAEKEAWVSVACKLGDLGPAYMLVRLVRFTNSRVSVSSEEPGKDEVVFRAFVRMTRPSASGSHTWRLLTDLSESGSGRPKNWGM